MKLLFALLGCVLCAASLHARIGETSEQITARYGPVVDANAVIDPLYPEECGELHRKGGISVYVVYQDSRAAYLRFVPGAGWKEEEVQTLLAASSDGRSWKKNEPGDARIAGWCTSYQCPTSSHDIKDLLSADNLSATWQHDGEHRQYLEISTVPYLVQLLRSRNTRDKDAAQKKLSGF